MPNEADTCRQYVVPQLQAAGWDTAPHSIKEQQTFTDGRVILAGRTARRGPQKRSDYLLRYTQDVPLAVVEAKADYKLPSDGLQQAKDYAEILGLSFAYATNGLGIVEFDYLTGTERTVEAYPAPAELWARLQQAQGLTETAAAPLLSPSHQSAGFRERYYQQIAINRAVQAIGQGKKRLLLTLATGTGKTAVAFQICWKLWNTRWNRTGEHRRPKILFLADRNILIDDPKDKTFLPFGDARHKIENGVVSLGRDIYFAIYQALAEDENRPGLYRQFPADFFDLIIVDECHRGAARDESSWRTILNYFMPATQLGLTATPKRDDNIDTYDYFGNPLYTYSLRQGIEDGFLAPYRVHRIISEWDAAGWRPSQADIDRYGRAIPDEEYQTKDFERVIALRARTEAIARHLTDFLKKTDRFAKTLIFCVDQEHAAEMRKVLTNLNSDLVQQYPDYVCRVTSAEGDIGRGHLSRFQDPETISPVILTTSQMLTTGVNAQTVKNVVLVRVIGSMTEFKQIIGRGTRLREDYGKMFFNILDYTGSATRLFADPAFDGEPAFIEEETMDGEGQTVPGSETVVQPDTTEGETEANNGKDETGTEGPEPRGPGPTGPGRKFYFDGGTVEITAHLVYELHPDGTQLRVVKFTDYTAERVRLMSPSADDLRSRWSDAEQRSQILAALEERGIDFAELAAATGQPDADPFDLLCHVAFNAPLQTRRERADRLRRSQADFFSQYGPEARTILGELLDKYAAHGLTQFRLPDALRVPPLSAYGNPVEVAHLFGGAQKMRDAVIQLQSLLYAA